VSPTPPTSAPGLRQAIRDDFAAHDRDWTTPGFRALAVYRFGRWAATRPAPLRWCHAVILRRVRRSYGIELDPAATIGRHVGIHHHSGVVVEAGSVVGDGCVIRQMVTIAAAPGAGAPVLGAGVDVGAGAVIVGPITIGDGARIGANASVSIDVPAGAVAAGVPAVVRG
jgi:serine O-acetyltransferase